MAGLLTRIARRAGEERHRFGQSLVEKGLLPGWSDYTKFVVLSDIRSGSTMLTNFLQSHPATRVFYEPFHISPIGVPFDVPGYLARGRSVSVSEERNTDPVSFLHHHLYTRMPKSIEAVGFKLIHTQARKAATWWDEPGYADWWEHVDETARLRWRTAKSDLWQALADDLSIKVILLERENPLEGVVSAELAKATGHWGIGATGGMKEGANEAQVTLQTDTLVRDLKAAKRHHADAADRFAKHEIIETSYERLVADPAEELARLQNFLGLQPSELKTKTRKQQKRPFTETVSNWDEVVTLLNKHDLSHLTVPGT
ncbi:MAG: Stf0 family sulfotransferase [Pseudomonadota bacterium]